MSKKEDFIVEGEKDREPRIEKTLEQKIASAQMRLNSLKSKDRTLS